jgi:hypothetical protein
MIPGRAQQEFINIASIVGLGGQLRRHVDARLQHDKAAVVNSPRAHSASMAST